MDYSVPYRDGVVLEPRKEFTSPPTILVRLSKRYLGDCVVAALLDMCV